MKISFYAQTISLRGTEIVLYDYTFQNHAVPVAQHERLLFLPASADPVRRSQFTNTCDGMIHARGIGGAFGLASGKLSMKNKPVLTYARPPQRSHIEIMGDKGIFL